MDINKGLLLFGLYTICITSTRVQLLLLQLLILMLLLNSGIWIIPHQTYGTYMRLYYTYLGNNTRHFLYGAGYGSDT